ncbi:hypothetical protein RFI_16356 [Reticulomyxa filosa]|uniref:Ion transport domain-containing protein n=1 Tax=Reticulomyxa filosa TaxID=46433 RepID=X6N4M1_RETFI|nr:hypothetical protein RFI_16356 [Reticulomyxa filosa]|eukprot:ETO20853.1 hypothetical protein RFI_16356 [Reticulomyxa filosa]
MRLYVFAYLYLYVCMYVLSVCESAYLKSWWNRLDMLVVIVAILGLIFPSVTFLRGLRAIRPIRVAIRVKQIKVVVKTLIHSLPSVINGVFFVFIVLFVLAIIGAQLFSGKLERCVYVGEPFSLLDRNKYPDKASCQGESVIWLNAGFNFGNVFSALLTIFKMSNFAHWFEDLLSQHLDCLYKNISDLKVVYFAAGMAMTEENEQPVPFHRPVAGIYYISVVIIGGFFLWNILVSVVVDSFMRIKQEETNALVTQDQAIWARTKRYVDRFPLINPKKIPRQPWRKRVEKREIFYFSFFFFCFSNRKIYNLVDNDKFEYFIVGCIIVNVIFMMSSYNTESKDVALALWAIDIMFVIIYWIEAILKIIGLGWRQYFRDLWNVFDFLIIVVSVISIGLSSPGQHHAANGTV